MRDKYELFTKKIKKIMSEDTVWNVRYDKIKSAVMWFEKHNGIINYMEID